ncbi:helix-turn-helix domain-containing protein [Synechococcus sp. CBW1107]|uniref:helix-turn-helix domain-containing protein n=1 Tax=Synechococcus sp. CBW1107 TaxID=2789857 RepID=UPI002AD23238|nr:helix-turn-helix domain-containing protein [Synechococcus sp. CBW1107]
MYQIEHFAGIGLTVSEIASLLRVSERTLYVWLHDPEVNAAFRKGRTSSLAVAGRMLWERINAGDLGAIIWYEKTRGHRSDRVHVLNEDDARSLLSNIRQLSDKQLRHIAGGGSPLDLLDACD